MRRGGEDEAGAMGSGSWFGKKREPKLAAPRKARADEVRIEPEDRPEHMRKRQGGARIEPFFEEQDAAPRKVAAEAPAAGKRARRKEPVDDLPEPDDEGAPSTPRKKKSKGKAKRRRSVLGVLTYYGAVLGVWCFIGLAALIAWHAGQLPPIDQLAVPKRPPNIAILADDGALLANRGDTGGAAIHIKDLPPYLPQAFIAIEDRRFRAHAGIDPLGIGRAVLRNVLRRGGGMEGGSTITQQLAKNLFLTQERTISRKIQEAILALWLEHRYSKDQILELYLNRVYFGSGAYGVEAAARKYFGRGAVETTLQEAAILAGLMKAPTKLAPNRNPNGAAERATQVILAMVREGYITDAMGQLALANPGQAAQPRGAGSVNYAADYVMDVLDDTLGAIDDDIVVTTTLSSAMQSAGELALTEELTKKGPRFGVTQGALVAVDMSGQIKALIGGRNYAESQFNRAVAARRQPGSSFKPFVYLSALERGLTPGTLREDAPINLKGWKPENSTHEYQGPVTLTRALSMSLNTVAVRLAMEVGPKTVIATAHRLGVASELRPDASIALGTSEVTPLELVNAYAPFANGGVGVQPHIIVKVRRADGKQLYQRKGSSFGRVIEPQYVGMMNAMLQETLLTGTARKAELPGWQAAGKTGTSQDYRDAWFVGYTSQLVAGVWLGNDDSSPTKRASGANLPVDIWSRFMREALRNTSPAPLPGGSWRDAGQSAQAPPPIPPADVSAPAQSLVPAPAPSAAMSTSAAPAPVARPASGPIPASPQVQAPPQPQAPPPPRAARRDQANEQANDLLPPASIPRGGQSKTALERLFGG